MSDLQTGVVTVLVGRHAHEVLAPIRMSGVQITLTRDEWPAGPLFRWAVYEKDRQKNLLPLPIATAEEMGGVGLFRDGNPGAPLTITLRWKQDDDRDLIRLELEAKQAFRTSIGIRWLP